MSIKRECHHNVVCILQGWIVPGAMHHGPQVTSRGGAVAPADHPERLDERVVEVATTK